MKRRSWVEFDNAGMPIRIFHDKKSARETQTLQPELTIAEVPHAGAIESIRRQVFERDEWQCVDCGEELTWESAQLDEVLARGSCTKDAKGDYHSGEQSVANGQTLCNRCHRKKTDRDPQLGTPRERIT